MKSDKFIECEGISNIIDDGVESSGGKGYSESPQTGDEGYKDKEKRSLYVKKVGGNGMDNY